ncbi:MAG: hypothetical protein OXH27_07480 [Gammaproteobacteria bacterium]|nr:hypothetical protein [Gammaproteobacteria bacterium]MCY3687784.1 hypothetical protein [Gammaproteobacteria bacterium]MXY90456.1 response regulator [Gammaproteobacteria bacterium]MYA36842.1 response regulator [Gammaproteobacteria bacterium]MYC59693.1 response regulator [Gammaproteobacteria bacterium]
MCKRPERLALLDLALPEVDGIELMERIPELSDLPVILLSVCGLEEFESAQALARLDRESVIHLEAAVRFYAQRLDLHVSGSFFA